ncbi:ADP-dependent NAD(P)H-hydrate dehydratase [Okibacterium endophyticum]
MSTWTSPTADDVRRWIHIPGAGDDKYTRGVLGMVTGSQLYQGAAVLGVEAAVRTGLGMVRYLGDASALVLQRRPEAVTQAGRVQAWLIGSGMDAGALGEAERLFSEALTSGLPVVADAGALPMVASGVPEDNHIVVTPHARELSHMLESAGRPASAGDIAAHPQRWAANASEVLGVTVLLKGSTTHVAAPSGERFAVADAPGWLATAGTGDVLAGIIGAMLATNAHRIAHEPGAIAAIAASAALLHQTAALLASRGAPIAALDVAEALPDAIRAVFRRRA